MAPTCFTCRQVSPSSSEQCGGDSRKPQPLAWFILAIITCLGCFLRWYRLDLISLRFDAAEALFRARETLALGYPPLTGIVNSLGFRNGPGFIWSILPPLLLTPDPRWATAWMGLLTITGLWPLYQICRRSFAPWTFVLPCTLYAVLPGYVFAGRNLWAQSLLPAMGLWCLYWLLKAISSMETRKVRITSGWACLAMASAAASVHLSGLAYVLIALAALVYTFRSLPQFRRVCAIATVAGALPLLTLVPSAGDWHRQRNHPQPKPPHIEKFEALMPPPESLSGRLADSLIGQFSQFGSIGILEGVTELKYPELSKTIRTTDLGLLVVCLAGFALAIVRFIIPMSRGIPADFQAQLTSVISLVWLILPAAVGSLILARVNATYFAMAAPVLLILVALGSNELLANIKCHKGGFGAIAALPLAILYSAYTVVSLHVIDSAGIGPGQYYIPLNAQRNLAAQLAASGVSADRFKHLSGPWFQRSYDYLLMEMERVPPGAKLQWAVADDQALRTQQPLRWSYFAEQVTLRQGTAGAVLFTDAVSARQLVEAFYNRPLE